VIPVPEERARPALPDARHHAQRFVLALALLIVLGAVLLALPVSSVRGEPTAPVDALFTAVSAASVTGLVVVDTADHWSTFGLVVILVLIQAGGLGFAVGASLLLLMLRRGQGSIGLRDALLLRAGAPALSLREAVDLTGRIVRFTFAAEAVGAVLLALRFGREMPAGDALWHGLFYSVAAFCNAGFDLAGGFASLSAYGTSPWVIFTIAALVQTGALSYVALADAASHRRWRPLALDTKLVLLTNAVLLATGALFFLAAEWDQAMAGLPTWAKPHVAVFQAVVPRSSGFTIVDLGEAHPVTLFAWVGQMLIGGASGSTAGGVKLATIAVVAAAVIAALRGQQEPQIFGRRLAPTLVFQALAVIVVFVLLHFLTTAVLAVTEDAIAARGVPFIALMFEAMSALATVGLSTGITPELSTAGKLLLCVAMFVGRLGPLTAVYALQQRQERVRYRHPEEPVRIG